jgi:hypothetical protein
VETATGQQDTLSEVEAADEDIDKMETEMKASR